MTVWLIEHNEYREGHRWARFLRDSIVGGHLDWDGNASACLQFAREEDARAFMHLHRDFCFDCRPTSHNFVSRAVCGEGA